jgi:phospholipase/carboxylesterase
MKYRLTVALFLGACHAASAPRSDGIEVYTGGARAGDRLPTIVALHGYSGSPDDIVGLLDGFRSRARVLAPRGPLREGTGWGWFRFQSSWARTPDELAPGLRAATDGLVRYIGEHTRDRSSCGRPIVVGFSQGGILSYALAARSPAVIGAALPLAGFIPPSQRPTTHEADSPRVTAFHGDADHVIDVAFARETLASFAAAGFASALRVYPGVAHEVSSEMANDIRAQLTREIRDQGCASP